MDMTSITLTESIYKKKMEMKSISILGMENESLDNYVCLLSISHS